MVTLAAAVQGQEILSAFSYDNLELSGLQADIGALISDRLESTAVGGLRVDYGFFAPRVRVVFGLSYARSDFAPEEIGEFEDRLRAVVVDPSGDDLIDVGVIRLTTVMADIDLQYLIPTGPQTRVFWYVGGGLSGHVRDGDGEAIAGTFVEDALDTIEAGISAMTVVEVALNRWLRLATEARGNLTSGLRAVSLRAGLMARFRGR